MTLKPLYMWAGGKSKLIKKYAPHFPDISNFKGYAEPFFGGGAIYGSIAEKFDGKLAINDRNSDLMGVFEALKANPDELKKDTRRVLETVLSGESKDERKAIYYSELKKYWSTDKPGELLALMKLGFNGIWQTKKESAGKFATPAGLLNQKDANAVLDKVDFDGWHQALQRTTIGSSDYRDLEFEPEGTLVYLDPPYRDSFTTYSGEFGDKEQEEVTVYAKDLRDRGATVLLANRYVDGDTFFEDLLPDATFHPFDVTYTAGRRKKVEDGFEAKKAREFLAILTPEGS